VGPAWRGLVFPILWVSAEEKGEPYEKEKASSV